MNSGILVTGGTGMVGSALLLKLTSTESPVKAIFRGESSLERVRLYFEKRGFPERFSRIDWVKGDVLDKESLSVAMEGISTVYHCAAVVSIGKSNSKELFRVNINGTKNMIDVALENEITCFCHVSSIAALGEGSQNILITEDSQFKTSGKNSAYSTSKYYSELHVWRGGAEGLPIVVVNPSFVLSPGWDDANTRKLAKTGNRNNRFYPAGSVGMVSAVDVAEAMVNLVASEIRSERFIISSENVAYKDFLTWLAQNFGKKAPVKSPGKFTTAIAGGASSLLSYIGIDTGITSELLRTLSKKLCYSNEKIVSATGIQFRPIREVVAEFCKSATEQGSPQS